MSLNSLLQGRLVCDGIGGDDLEVVNVRAGLAIARNGSQFKRVLAVSKANLLKDLGLGSIGAVLAQVDTIELLAVELHIKGAAAKVLVSIGLDTRAVKRDAHARTSAGLGLGAAVMLMGLAAPRAPATLPGKCGVRMRLVGGVLDNGRGLACNGKRDVARARNTRGVLGACLDLDHTAIAGNGQQAVRIDGAGGVAALGANRPRHVRSGGVGRSNLGGHLKGRTALRENVHAISSLDGNLAHCHRILVQNAEGVELDLGTRGCLGALLCRSANDNRVDAGLKVILGEDSLLARRRGSVRIDGFDNRAVDGNLKRAAVPVLAGDDLDARARKRQRGGIGTRGLVEVLNGAGIVVGILVPVAPVALIGDTGVLVIDHAGHVAQVLDIDSVAQLAGGAIGDGANAIRNLTQEVVGLAIGKRRFLKVGNARHPVAVANLAHHRVGDIGALGSLNGIPGELNGVVGGL